MKENKSKIEKIYIDRVFMTDIEERLMDKINQIIDYLNSQWAERNRKCMKCGKLVPVGESINTNKDGSFRECDECLWKTEDTMKEREQFTEEELECIERVTVILDSLDNLLDKRRK